MSDKGVHLYFTFGTGSLLRGRYVSLTAPDEETARHAMDSTFAEWAGMYYQPDFEQIAAKYRFELLCSFDIAEGGDE